MNNNVFPIINSDNDTEFWADCTTLIQDIMGNVVISAKILLCKSYMKSDYESSKLTAETEWGFILKEFNSSKEFEMYNTLLVIEFSNHKTIQLTTSSILNIINTETV